MKSWKKILGTSFLATTVTLSGVGPVLMNGSTASAKTAQSDELPSSPIDMNTVPEERLANALKNQGVISQSATPQEVKKAVTSYINKKDAHKESMKGHKASKIDLKAKEMQTKAAEQKKLLEHYEEKGYLYGRQAQDLKSHTAALVRKYEETAEENLKEAALHRQMAAEMAKHEFATREDKVVDAISSKKHH